MIALRRPASRLPVRLLAAAVAASALSACAYNEALGRNQLLLVDNAALAQQSNAAWREAISKPGVQTSGAQVDRIRRVGNRLVQAAGLGDRTWDYAVFSEKSPNAFVLPSGQIGVTDSLLALVQNDDQLATVIGHEIGHVVANHAAERASSQAATSIGLAAVGGAAVLATQRRRYVAQADGIAREQARPALASVACMVALVVGLAALGITATLLHAT